MPFQVYCRLWKLIGGRHVFYLASGGKMVIISGGKTTMPWKILVGIENTGAQL